MLKKFSAFELKTVPDVDYVRARMAERPPQIPKTTETVSFWGGFDAPLSVVTEGNTSLGAYFCGSFVVATKKVPAAKFKAAMQAEIEAYERENGSPPSRKWKMELKQHLLEALLTDREPDHKVLQWILVGRRLFAEATTPKQKDTLISFFREAFNEVAAPVSPDQIHQDVEQPITGHDDPVSLSSDALMYHMACSNGDLLVESPIKMEHGAPTGARAVTFDKGNPFTDPSFIACVRESRQVTSAKVSFVKSQQVWTTKFDAVNDSFSSVKYPAEEGDIALDPISRKQAQIQKMEELLDLWLELAGRYCEKIRTRGRKAVWEEVRGNLHVED